MRLDTGKWKEFRIGDLFDLFKGTRLTKANMIDGDIRFVSAANVNNGVTTHIGNNEHVHSEGTITVCYNGNGGTGKAFYQDSPYWASDDVHVLYPKFQLPKEFGGVEWAGLNAPVGLFLATAIEKVGRQKYGFTVKWKLEYMREDKIKLPVDAYGKPDWPWMNEFMGAVTSDMADALDLCLDLNKPCHVTHERQWLKFKLSDLFEITKGTRLTKAERIEGETPYVGASQIRNGITHHIGNTGHVHDGHCLTVCYNGPVGTTFYQPVSFWATDDVNILRPKKDVSANALLFIAPIIERIGTSNYAYVDKWKQEDMLATLVPLPATKTGAPDWNFMDAYMRGIMDDMENELETLCTAI